MFTLEVTADNDRPTLVTNLFHDFTVVEGHARRSFGFGIGDVETDPGRSDGDGHIVEPGRRARRESHDLRVGSAATRIVTVTSGEAAGVAIITVAVSDGSATATSVLHRDGGTAACLHGVAFAMGNVEPGYWRFDTGNRSVSGSMVSLGVPPRAAWPFLPMAVSPT